VPSSDSQQQTLTRTGNGANTITENENEETDSGSHHVERIMWLCSKNEPDISMARAMTFENLIFCVSYKYFKHKYLSIKQLIHLAKQRKKSRQQLKRLRVIAE
jgi:hypothetical protein